MDLLKPLLSLNAIVPKGTPTPLVGLAALGSLVLLRLFLGVAKLVYNTHIRGGINLSSFGAGKNSWAVITGASDGIGREFATQLAGKKFNVVLVSRTESKLKDLARHIEDTYNVKTKVVAMDFTKTNDESYRNLKAALEETPDIGVLVNNVGTNHDYPTPFLQEHQSLCEDIINVNIIGTMRVTRMVAPKMVTARKGLIINIGSFAGLLPQPFLSVYSGSKSFLLTWSQALGKELAKDNVLVECLNTYFVVSSMSKIRRPNFTTPTPKHYVASVLKRIGNPGGSSIPFTSSPFFSHAILNFVVENFGSNSFWLNRVFAIQGNIRKRAMMKIIKEGKKPK
ncbi:hypothetical protein BKA69DRAFT_1086821 [Paraphysoderma sedebokerense]|nr:hypothetical protein BKA69DRAFT_1086821 [Paraphysoderma sedebokerense]